jgi:hypothetical protein
MVKFYCKGIYSSREVEGPALRNLGNRSIKAGAKSGRVRNCGFSGR